MLAIDADTPIPRKLEVRALKGVAADHALHTQMRMDNEALSARPLNMRGFMAARIPTINPNTMQTAVIHTGHYRTDLLDADRPLGRDTIEWDGTRSSGMGHDRVGWDTIGGALKQTI